MNWLYKNWPYAGILTAGFLVLLAPFCYASFGLPFTLLYLHLPMYQVHQLEEHYHDRFRRHVNETLGRGLEVLTAPATFWINSLGVWVLDLLAFYVAFYVNLGWGLAVVYLVIVNGLGHIAMAVRERSYNPGLWTSILLFLPIGGWSLHVISTAARATSLQHAVGLAIAVAVHVAIMALILGRKRKLTLLADAVAPDA